MALIKNFPVPSDRMAIISTLLNIEDAVVLEYGPEGTTHFSMNFFNKLGQDYPNRLFTTKTIFSSALPSSAIASVVVFIAKQCSRS